MAAGDEERLSWGEFGFGQWSTGAGHSCPRCAVCCCVSKLQCHCPLTLPSASTALLPLTLLVIVRERKFSLFCAVRLCFWADDCILKRHCVRLEKASLSERFWGGGFGTTAHKTDTWLCYLPACHQIHTVHLLPRQQKGWKRRKADHTFLQAMASHYLVLSRQGRKCSVCLSGFQWRLVTQGCSFQQFVGLEKCLGQDIALTL